ncbi:MAG: glycosyl transferase [Omnitrophica WOR_2 bacterium GWF2_38_59]|nr:MAG: glycosyl transferase [Omnitrophica WOR_2 bacterium GWF2_38_59]OGX48883.1 MAG: glycosyl transferase [Omnitrophica WOR_2 bacterium RIFOXYA2_FULL_38_17]OGX52563.1 MAG: glycosyl transferase [Omnitrophica WOR_2 bacterium RIFOXYA12_FULL_38_10]OGX56857.1 MAG: glycosyl transferase [Omnitrophica WOR_2 bacterium RIFOXYB2_FULL_38_16]OGX57612.1 MAG: glycosyl transferase [Omnitrophica WOR_2 bacterium RIFOXYC2_FULL_38_12]HBG60796.1 glycosyl transferase [Candidatus Omnitrophota bacterium]
MKLIIQIPCLNEEESLPKTLSDLPKHIDGIDIIETLIIDDGSTDRTSAVAKECGVNHIVRFTSKKGLAKVFHAGLDASLKKGADIIVNTDADGQYKGEDIPRLVKPILEGTADIVIGNRDIENIKQFSWIKKRLQRIGSAVIRILSGSNIPDATTGFRAYNKEAALRLNIISEYTYTLESIIQAEHKGLAITNIIVHTNRVDRPSRLFKSIPHYIKRSIVTMIRVFAMFNPLRMFLNLGSVSLCIGTLIGCRFLFHYLMGGGYGKIQSLILAAVFLIIGFQLLIMGLVSDLISANRRLIEDTLLRVKKIEINIKRKDINE